MKQIVAVIHFIIILLVVHLSVFAQKDAQRIESGRLSPKEFTISASPVFDLMGVTPSQINRASDVRDFKVDWLFKSWKMNPNFAIQAQPLWEVLYNRKDLSKYQQASSFMRKLSTLDVSFGSIQTEDGDRRIGFSVKLNLYKEKDPLLAKELYNDLDAQYNARTKALETHLTELNLKLDSTRNILTKQTIRNQIDSAKQLLTSIVQQRSDEINYRSKLFVAENWNASSLDVAFGRVNTYQLDSAGSIGALRKNRNTGWGAWLNGSLGLGKYFLLSGLFRCSIYDEQVNFSLKNNATQQEAAQNTIAINKLFTMGINMRYGGPIYTFFVEFLYEQKQLRTALDAIDNAFQVPNGNFTIVQSSTKWTVVHPNAISFGGDWRINRNLILNYGTRSIFDKDWKFTTFTPVATISCMMR